VMDKLQSPRGLIRYATQNGLALQGPHPDLTQPPGPALAWRRLLRPRVLVYGTVLIAIALAFVTSLGLRHTLKVDVVRDRATLARIVEDGLVENVYRLQLMNATEAPQRYRLAVSGIPSAALAVKAEVALEPAEARWVTVAVRVLPEQAAALKPGAHPIHFEVTPLDAAADAVVEKSTFVIPR
jgi:polyferredoxin